MFGVERASECTIFFLYVVAIYAKTFSSQVEEIHFCCCCTAAVYAFISKGSIYLCMLKIVPF